LEKVEDALDAVVKEGHGGKTGFGHGRVLMIDRVKREEMEEKEIGAMVDEDFLCGVEPDFVAPDLAAVAEGLQLFDG